MLVFLMSLSSPARAGRGKQIESIPRAPCQRLLERSAIDFDSRKIQLRDAPRVADVIERIGVKHEEIRALAWRERAPVGEAEEFRRAACGSNDHLRRRHAALDHELQLLLFG